MAGDNDIVGIPPVTTGPEAMPGGQPDLVARLGGLLLLITAIATAVTVYGRVASGADQATLLESLSAVAESRGLYGLFGATRLVSGLTLLAAGWFLLRAWIIKDRWATPWVPYLFVASGVCTAVSGACAILIAFQADAGIASVNDVAGIGVVADLLWIAGKVGLTGAGLALLVAAWFQWQVGGALRKVAPASVSWVWRRSSYGWMRPPSSTPSWAACSSCGCWSQGQCWQPAGWSDTSSPSMAT